MSECTCGHMKGDHKSGGGHGLAARRYGICLVPDCGCREYAEAPSAPERAT